MKCPAAEGLDEGKVKGIMDLLAEQGLLVDHGHGNYTLSVRAAVVLLKAMDRHPEFTTEYDKLTAALVECVTFFAGAVSEETAVPKREVVERVAVLRAAIASKASKK